MADVSPFVVAPPLLQQQHSSSPRQMSPTQAQSGQFGNASLYVGDLHSSVDEAQLFELFGQIGPVTSVRVCRDHIRKLSLGYAYVNYHNPQDANRAMEVLNFTPVNGKVIRVMFSHRDPSIRKSGLGNVFIKNLDPTIDNKTLYEIFATFGTVLSCKVATTFDGQSKGYGFVQFENEDSAQRAINQLNKMLINGKLVYVGAFIRRQERDKITSMKAFTNVYVKNLPGSYTEDDLKNVFKECGTITSGVIMKEANGKSRGFGFLNFSKPDEASAAIEKFNGKVLVDKILYVGKAQKKAERLAELRAKYEQESNERTEKLQGRSLYVKNLDDSINDENLKELFIHFGTLTACKVMRDMHGNSKGTAFLAFSSMEEASRAISGMNGKMVGKKPLYVATFQSKEERKARLQAHFAQFDGQGTPTGTIHGYQSLPPTLAPQQLYFGQGNPSLFPSQPSGYGFQQQLIPGIRPAVSNNYIMPYSLQRQGHPGQRMGFRRGMSQQTQQQQQLTQRNATLGFRYMQNAHNGIDPTLVPQNLVSPLMPMPLSSSGIPFSPADAVISPPTTMASLISALASATPEEQTVILGHQLYPLVERIEHDQAGKVTGMLLEMDQNELLHLIESPDDLEKKVAEAMEVLQLAQASGSDAAADQLGSLSLNE